MFCKRLCQTSPITHILFIGFSLFVCYTVKQCAWHHHWESNHTSVNNVNAGLCVFSITSRQAMKLSCSLKNCYLKIYLPIYMVNSLIVYGCLKVHNVSSPSQRKDQPFWLLNRFKVLNSLRSQLHNCLGLYAGRGFSGFHTFSTV